MSFDENLFVIYFRTLASSEWEIDFYLRGTSSIKTFFDYSCFILFNSLIIHVVFIIFDKI